MSNLASTILWRPCKRVVRYIPERKMFHENRRKSNLKYTNKKNYFTKSTYNLCLLFKIQFGKGPLSLLFVRNLQQERKVVFSLTKKQERQ